MIIIIVRYLLNTLPHHLFWRHKYLYTGAGADRRLHLARSLASVPHTFIVRKMNGSKALMGDLKRTCPRYCVLVAVRPVYGSPSQTLANFRAS